MIVFYHSQREKESGVRSHCLPHKKNENPKWRYAKTNLRTAYSDYCNITFGFHKLCPSFNFPPFFLIFLIGFCVFIGNLNKTKKYEEIKSALVSYLLTESLLVQDIRLHTDRWELHFIWCGVWHSIKMMLSITKLFLNHTGRLHM